MKTIKAFEHGDIRSKCPRVLTLREMTLEEVKSMHYNFDVKYVSERRNGVYEAFNIRQNGKPKTWKTKPNDVDVPMKYGFRECFHSRMVNGEWVENTLYLEVDE